MKTHLLSPTYRAKFFFGKIVLALLLLLNQEVKSQIAAWDLTGQASPATFAATTFNANLISSTGANNITRGGGAASSTGSNSFRTTGFQNNGIAVTNTDYFQITLTANAGFNLSLSTIDAKFAGTATFAASPGVSSQFAYSLNGTTFTLIGSPAVTIGTPATLPQIILTSITALQNVPAGTTITLRYYASGQTTTGGWGFNSPSAGANGLAIGGAVNPAGSIATLANITQPSGPITQGTNDVVLAGFTLGVVGGSANFSTVTVSSTGTATSADLSNVRIYRDNDANGAINGSDAAVTVSAQPYSGAMAFSITGETGITTTRNYLIVGDVAGAGFSTVGNTTTLSIQAGGYATTAATNSGSATGNLRTIAAANTPTITLTGSVAAFTGFVGSATYTKNYSVSGINLTTAIVIVPPVPFEISLDSISWTTSSGSINLSPVANTVSNTIIYVRYNPVTAGSTSSNITHNSTGATVQNMPVTGTAAASPGPLLYSITGSTSFQNFDGLPLSGGVLNTTGFGSGPVYVGLAPVNATGGTGWQYARISGSTTDVKFTVDAGTATSGSAMSYGLASNSDRALGTLSSGANTDRIGLVLKNSTTDVLTRVTITYVGEQWRNGGSGLPNRLEFSYSLNGTSISNGTYSKIPSLDFSSPVTGNPAASLNGNISPNRTTITHSFSLNGNWLPGQLLIIRWDDIDEPGSEDGLSVDSFAFTAQIPIAPGIQDNNISFPSTTTSSMKVKWVNGDGSNHLVVISNSPAAITAPTNGGSYTASSIYSGSGEQNVYIGSGDSVIVTGLSPGTIYYFQVFGFNGSGSASVFNTSTATLNPNNNSTSPLVAPTKLVITSVNGGVFPYVNQPFSVVVQAQDNSGNPQPVIATTNFDLSVQVGIGTLASGVFSGSIAIGTTTATLTGVIYDQVDNGVQLQADVTSGDPLTAQLSNPFNVLDAATALRFDTIPSSGIQNVTISHIVATAILSDLLTKDIGYTGAITLAVNTGPVGGTITGTTMRNAIGGSATFNDIQFTLPGTYTITASASGLTPVTSSNIIITALPTMTELVVPRYIGSKSTASANECRTPLAICIRLDNLLPTTTYNMSLALGDIAEANTVLGAGTIWNDTSFASASNYGAFTTNPSGSSGPVWVFFQPSGNTTRFAAGQIHNIRIAYSTGALTSTPNFVGTKTITALDIPTTDYTPGVTTDDGAFLKGSSVSCIGGKFVLVYDNVNGTGDPLFAYQARQATATGTNNGQLPTAISNVYNQNASSVIGDYVAVIPIGANNPNGVRRIEIRNSGNSVVNFASDADGIWPSGANTTTIARRGVASITNTDAFFNTVSVAATSTNANCFGALNGTLIATASSTFTPITYLWTPGGATTANVNSVGAATYTVVATDANGCSASSSTTISQPSQIITSGAVTNTDCTSNIGAIDLTVSGGSGGYSYSWSNGSTIEDLSGLAGGSYSVTVTDAALCTATQSFTVLTINTTSPLTITASPAAVCPGGTSTLNASGAVTYSWSPATYLSGTSGATVTSTPSAPITYTVTGVDGTGCQSTGTISVGINTAPVINASGSTTICSGQSVTLSTTSVGTYSWSNGATTQSISASSAGQYSVTVDYGSGCVLTSSVTNVVVNNFVFTGILYSENIGSPAATTDVNSYFGWQATSPVTYLSTSTLNQADVRTTTASSGYTGASAGGNVFFGVSGGNSKNLFISGINTQGFSTNTLTFGLLRTTITADLTLEISTDGITFTPLTYTAPPTQNVWALCTVGGIPQASNLRIKFSKNNSTSFRLDDIKLTGTTTTVDIAASGPLINCGGTGITLTSNIPSGNVWSYNSSTAKSLSISALGPFSTTVTATGSNGCTLTSAVISGQINPSPSVAITSTTNVACFGELNGSATASASGGTGTLGYSWNTSPVQTTPSITNLAAGTYIVTATDVNGCTGTNSAIISQPSQISITVGVSDTVLCEGQSILLSSSGSNSKAFTALNSTPVNIPDSGITGVTPVSSSVTVSGLNITGLTAGQIANVKINSITHTYTGDLVIRLIAPDGRYLTLAARRGLGANFVNTLFTPSATTLISAGSSPFTATYVPDTAVAAAAAFSVFDGVNPNGTWSLQVFDSASVDIGTIDSWSITFLNPLSYSWTSTPAGFSSSVQSPGTVTPSTLGLGNVTYTATATNSFNGCSASNSFTVTVNPLPTPTITGNLSFCAGNSTTLGTTSSYSGYIWTGGSSASTLTVNTGGTYAVTVTDVNGCSGTQSVVVTENPNPVPTISATTTPAQTGNPITICSGESAILNTDQTFDTYSWNDGISIISTNQNVTVTPTANTIYTLTVSNNGCSGSATFEIDVVTCGGNVTLNATMYLEGYYAASNTGLMDNYGTGGCLFVNSISLNSNDVDTVEISMMDAATYALVDAQKGILQVNGSVSVTFSPLVTAGTAYYIRVKHKNAVQTWSASPVMTSATTTYDFSTAVTQAYGNNMVQTQDLLHWAFYSGDLSDAGSATIGIQDEVIESQDYSDMENAIFITLGGYTFEDITGDGVVESLDYSILENNVFFTIQSLHP